MRLILFVFLGVLATPLRAGERSSMLFDVRILGLHAGVVELAANMTDSAYAAKSRVRTSGLVGALKRARADVSVQGRVAGDTLRPNDYSEAIDDGKRVTDVKVRFAPGQPRLVSGDPGSSAPPADTSGLGGAIDPLTLLYLVLRDQPREQVCQLAEDIYDGHRHARIVLTRRQANGEGITCKGYYKRVAGYGQSDRDKKDVNISVDYVPAGDVMRAARVEFDTRLGPAVMERR